MAASRCVPRARARVRDRRDERVSPPATTACENVRQTGTAALRAHEKKSASKLERQKGGARKRERCRGLVASAAVASAGAPGFCQSTLAWPCEISPPSVTARRGRQREVNTRPSNQTASSTTKFVDDRSQGKVFRSFLLLPPSSRCGQAGHPTKTSVRPTVRPYIHRTRTHNPCNAVRSSTEGTLRACTHGSHTRQPERKRQTARSSME